MTLVLLRSRETSFRNAILLTYWPFARTSKEAIVESSPTRRSPKTLSRNVIENSRHAAARAPAMREKYNFISNIFLFASFASVVIQQSVLSPRRNQSQKLTRASRCLHFQPKERRRRCRARKNIRFVREIFPRRKTVSF